MLINPLTALDFSPITLKSVGHYWIKVIERYIELLDTEQIVAFACTYTERVFDGNPNEGKIFAANLWQKPFDMMMKTMSATKDMFIGCMADEEECAILGADIAMLKFDYSSLKNKMQVPEAVMPVEEIDSLLNKVNPLRTEAKKEDNDLKLSVLMETWWGLNHFLRKAKQDEELGAFDDKFPHDYHAHLLSKASLIRDGRGSMPTERMFIVTEQEIKAGRMTEDHPLRQNAINAKAEGLTVFSTQVCVAFLWHGNTLAHQGL